MPSIFDFEFSAEDALDKKYMLIRKSEEGEGEGAYATRDIPKGSIIAIYGGYLLTVEEFNNLTVFQTEEREKLRFFRQVPDSQIEDFTEGHYTYRYEL